MSIGATCRDRAGRNQPADFDLNGYHNIDGRLVFDGKGKSSFQRSCDVINVRVSPERVLLTAECRARNQSVRKTTIEIQNIQNIDGRLVRTAATAAPPPPACNGLAGRYNRGASTVTVANDNRVRVTVGPNRPAGTGSCNGNRLTINFPDDRAISGIFTGRTIVWDNRTTWTKD